MDLYSYDLPEKCIAQKPASPRDASRLLIYNTQTEEIHWDHFIHLSKYLPKDSFLVMNETKVLPARVHAMLENGKPAELIIFPSEVNPKKHTLKATANLRLRNGQKIFLSKKHLLEVCEDTEKAFTFRPNFPLHALPKILLQKGCTPIPNYIKHSSLSEKELRKKYQSIFAKNPGSVAAPTASLHFTHRVFKSLDTAGVKRLKVTLHVGLGTFAPVLPEHLKTRTLYQEHTNIEPAAAHELYRLKKAGKRCTAVGTTSVRTLESFARGIKEKTDLFILPPFDFQMVDQLITNFHLPNSSLMMLVEAFLQHKGAKKHLKELYALALQKNFRFYSFGDSMLIL